MKLHRFNNFLNEAVPQDGFHNKFFKDPTPGLTNFTEIAVCTKPVSFYTKSQREPGNKYNPTMETIEVKQPFKYKAYHGSESIIDKLYIYKIHYQGQRYANSEFPNQMFSDGLTNRGGEVWVIKYDADKQSVFSPYPLYAQEGKMPKEVYEYFSNYKGETKSLPGMAEIKRPLRFYWIKNIHKGVTLYFDENSKVVEIENTLQDLKWYKETKREGYSDDDHNASNISIDVSDWMGKKIDKEYIKKFLADNYPWMSYSGLEEE
jgi:hypothetical protein